MGKIRRPNAVKLATPKRRQRSWTEIVTIVLGIIIVLSMVLSLVAHI